MRVLQANKFFFHRGGAETVFFDTIEALRQRGHEVSEFSMQKKENLPSEFSGYFGPELPDLSQKQDWWTAAKVFKHLFCSKEIDRKLTALILETDPEVAHLHNVYHHLSATTFITLKKHHVPIVMTVHDVQPMCPNHRMVRGTDDALCEKCFRHKYYNCVIHSCINRSRVASLAGAAESYFYHLKKIWDLIDIFICPSQFMMDKMVSWGFAAKKMRLLRNPFTIPEKTSPLGNKVVYIGRVHTEKGIKIFLRALAHLREYEAAIAGNGPEDKWVETMIKQRSLTNVRRIKWVHGESKRKLLEEARVVVVPSLFYENCSITILEALAGGRLVIASDRGGNNELIINDHTGFLVRPDDPQALVDGIKEAMQLTPLEADLMIKNGRELIRDNHSLDKYAKGLEAIYQEVRR